MGRSMLGKLTIPLLLSTLWPTLVLAEVPRGIGIVTALEGQATVTRAILSQQPLPLKFRDQVFFKDRISTEEHSIVRVLLKDKAVITVRELSTLTITEAEERGRVSVLDLLSGKLSLAVARLRMVPGRPSKYGHPTLLLEYEALFWLWRLPQPPPRNCAPGRHLLSRTSIFSKAPLLSLPTGRRVSQSCCALYKVSRSSGMWRARSTRFRHPLWPGYFRTSSPNLSISRLRTR